MVKGRRKGGGRGSLSGGSGAKTAADPQLGLVGARRLNRRLSTVANSADDSMRHHENLHGRVGDERGDANPKEPRGQWTKEEPEDPSRDL